MSNKALSNWTFSTLSSREELLLKLADLDSNANYYNNIKSMCKVRGPLDFSRLKSSIQKIIDNHEAFSTGYTKNSTGYYQRYIQENMTWELTIDNIKDDTEANSYFHNIAFTFLLPDKPPLWRVFVLKNENEEYYIILYIHHLICDAMSIRIFWQDLSKLYNNTSLAELNAKPYSQFVKWHYEQQDKIDLPYWRQKLTGVKPVNFPYFNDHNVGENCAAIEGFSINKDTYKQLDELSKRYKISIYVILLSCLQKVLYELTLEKRFCISLVYHNRTHGCFQNTIGFVASMIPCTFDYNENSAILEQVLSTDKTLQEHFSIARGEIGYILKNKHNLLNRMPNIEFNYIPAIINNYSFKLDDAECQISLADDPRIPDESHSHASEENSFYWSRKLFPIDSTITAIQHPDSINLEIFYRKRFFEKSYVQEFCQKFKCCLTDILSKLNTETLKLSNFNDHVKI
ncbi:condensation domain-containing protein [Candidatus Paracaedibacter symbiosus]|uniref:condensation domain-containing protein n=1 Tax=Candidatus Paracaedibacter symbiosus TaxID=244582 RepID=UPI0005098C8B|nr:condensation domain-containing protein [Candidatus Paracaedibacter symbiosus]